MEKPAGMGEDGPNEASKGIAAVFDGHGRRRKQIFVGNLGDQSPRMLFLGRKTHIDEDNEDDLLKDLEAEELTKDHHPDRDDEKARTQLAGGLSCCWRVSGQWYNSCLTCLLVIFALKRCIFNSLTCSIAIEFYGHKDLMAYFERTTPRMSVIFYSENMLKRTNIHRLVLCPSSSSLADCMSTMHLVKGLVNVRDDTTTSNGPFDKANSRTSAVRYSRIASRATAAAVPTLPWAEVLVLSWR
ncbi:hypothetical protein HAX54_027611 [Datura stramonium]|uniref:protein-serine/threonine phosphatase n=1 Tax=Datura stramonium TaxID=4076 RepID=A0ABS8V2Y4_DATST|nr:hypothetical protein [Datura stramonium]